jgi:hypothetical protein
MRTKISTSARVLLLAILVSTAGCDFSAENPMAITEDGLTNLPAIQALVNGVIGDYDQSYQRSALYAGLISDEVRASGSWSWWHDADKEGLIDVDAPTGDLMNIPHHWWRPLSRARFLADETFARIQDHVEGPEAAGLSAMTRLYSGMAYRDAGEYFCQAAYDGGPPVPPGGSLEMAEDHLSQAITAAGSAGIDSIASMAHLVRARVRLSLGDDSGALSDARAVPDGFQWVAHFRNASGESNGMVFQLNHRVEATIQDPYHDMDDPRVPVIDTGKKGADNLTPRWDQQKLDRYGDMPMGTWQEARLIEAEVLLEQGNVSDAIALMNEVRDAAEMEPLSGSLTSQQAQDALRYERKAELFLMGQRMLDMRRWNLFPDGWQAECSPLPRAETDNNPNF